MCEFTRTHQPSAVCHDVRALWSWPASCSFSHALPLSPLSPLFLSLPVLPVVDNLQFEPSPIKAKQSSPAAAASSSVAPVPLGALPYVPHTLYAGHADAPQLLTVSDIQAEIQRCIRMVAESETAQVKQFPYFIIESASGTGKTRFALELLQRLREERTAAAAQARLHSDAMEVDTAVVSGPTASSIHFFPHYVMMCSSLELATEVEASAEIGFQLLIFLLYRRGGRVVSWEAVTQLTQPELKQRLVTLLQR